MRKIFFSFLVIVFFKSCSPNTEYSNWHVGEGGFNPNGNNLQAQDPTLDCDPEGSGCQRALDHWGHVFDDIIVLRAGLDSLYYHYSRNTLSELYAKINLHYYFPVVDRDRPGALDKLVTGEYDIVVLADSSVVIRNNPGEELKYENIIFAFDRDAEQ